MLSPNPFHLTLGNIVGGHNNFQVFSSFLKSEEGGLSLCHEVWISSVGLTVRYVQRVNFYPFSLVCYMQMRFELLCVAVFNIGGLLH